MAANIIQQKRLRNESKLLKEQPLSYITAYSDDKNPLIWYFLLVGQKDTEYAGGYYIGEIHHSPKYPAEPPDYYMRTPNGRYEVNKKICLTNSSYHKGDWSSTWNIHSILIAFYSIWLDDIEHGISHIKRSKEERKILADESIIYNKKNYLSIWDKFDFTTLSDDASNIKLIKKNETPKIIEKEEIKNKVVKEEIKEQVNIKSDKLDIDQMFTNINNINISINNQEIGINKIISELSYDIK
jgi:ubiquitin-protein ligase